MNCQEFTFLHTSGQFEEAGWLTRLKAEPHRLICRQCRQCRNFAHNNAQISAILRSYHETLQRLEPTPPRYSEPISRYPSRF